LGGGKVSVKKKKKTTPAADILVRKFPLNLNSIEHELVDRLRKESARLWNDAIDLHWWLYDVYKIWSDASEKKKWFNAKTHKLHAQTIQAIIELHEETCKRTKEQRDKGNLNWKYPWKYKGYFSVKYKKIAISFDGEFLIFSNGRKEEQLKIKKPNHIDFESIKNAEIVWHFNQYWLHVGLEIPKKAKVTGKNTAGGDPGEIHALTLSNGTSHLIITGKELRAAHQFRNKILAKLSRKISKKKKGSKSFWKLVERKRKFLAKMDRRIEYLEHAISKMAIDWCVENNVKKLFIGNPDGVQKNTKKKHSKKINQKLSNWSFGRLYKKIEYKGKLQGIKVEKINESYTSGTCPKCSNFKKQTGRTFKCSNCGETGHRDVVGAINIREKAIHKKITGGRNVPKLNEVKYRRVCLTHVKQIVA
jgi:putative transposase